ncbi:MAG: ferric reductase-like transmembrane domain-containing protein, partial [Litoricola sp.]|nr:ferric reductase-like transmembrane domain-containing protein [Litorivicinus sp.]
MTIIFSFICLLVLAPLGLSWMSVETYRDIWTEIGTALGMIGFSALLTLFLLSGRVRWLSQSLNIDLTMRWHRWLGFLVLGAAFLHPFFFTGSLAGGERPWDPTRALTITTDFAPLASGIAAFILIPAFIMLAIWHSALGYRYETWRRIHALGGCLFVLLLLHHTITAGRYGSQ